MCGIHGVVALREGALPARALLDRMGDVTVHRGPDDAGTYSDEHVLLGMRRLSIIDLSGGQQPIANEDETIWVVCNGEIYNFRELRATLESKGHRFRTASDCEVIVHAYETWGEACVDHLEGMFGFALWDSERRRLLIGRDRLGIKPLYYTVTGGVLAFASEVKALLQIDGVTAGVDPAALSEFLSLGYVPGALSMFEGVRKLPPAHLMIVSNGELRQHEYWRLPETSDDQRSLADWAEETRTALARSVRRQMVSDVPLGAFLSGGIDSSAVVAMMSEASDEPVRTYSIGFDATSGGSYYNELPYARQVAELFGTRHREILVRPDVAELLPMLTWHLDEPMADAAFITTYLVSRFAREDVTVILSGVGGDELFGGYRRYLGEYYGRLYRKVPGWLRSRVLGPIARRLPSDRHSPLLNLSRYARGFLLASELPFEDRYRSYVEVSDAARRGALRDDAAEAKAGDDALSRAFAAVKDGDELYRLMAVDLRTQLPDDLLLLTDKMSMAVSLECRVPLLDERLVALAARMPSRHKIRGRTLKQVLKIALEPVLPREILYRKKRGFGAPMGAWIKRELAPLLHSLLGPDAVRRRGLFNPATVAETIRLHEQNKADFTDLLLGLINLEVWCKIFLDGCSTADLGAEMQALRAA